MLECDTPPDEVLCAYTVAHRIRAFEEQAYAAHRAGHVRGGIHSYVGQEAVAAGVSAHLTAEDFVSSYHRGHGHAIAKGADPKRMMKEILGRQGGTCGGHGGSMHIADFGVGMVGANGIVGDGVSLAVGAAHSLRLLGRHDAVSVAYFGDGAINRGPVLEAMNWACVYGLPVLFVCEDNLYSASTRTASVIGGPGFAQRAEALGVLGAEIDGNDLLATLDTARRLLAQIRSGEGPRFLYAHTFRFESHNIRFTFARDEVEIDAWRQRDPLPRAHRWLVDRGVPDEELGRIEVHAREEMLAAFQEALAAPLPPPDAALEHVQLIGAPRG